MLSDTPNNAGSSPDDITDGSIATGISCSETPAGRTETLAISGAWFFGRYATVTARNVLEFSAPVREPGHPPSPPPRVAAGAVALFEEDSRIARHWMNRARGLVILAPESR